MPPAGSSRSSPRLRLWLERGEAGFHLRDAETELPLDWTDERILVVKVAGASYRSDALADDAFAPGRRLALVAEPGNEHDPNALGIWDSERRLQAGYVPAETAARISADDWQAISLWEFVEGGRRVGLRVLLAPTDAWVGAPRA
jgi:hypothetical protein